MLKLSSALSVKPNCDPAVTLAGTARNPKCVAAAALTVITNAVLMLLAESLALTVLIPAVFSVTPKTCTPASVPAKV